MLVQSKLLEKFKQKLYEIELVADRVDSAIGSEKDELVHGAQAALDSITEAFEELQANNIDTSSVERDYSNVVVTLRNFLNTAGFLF